MTVRLDVDTRRLNRILRNLGGNTAQAVRKIAFRVEAKAKVNIQQHGLIDTGAMVNSVYTSTNQGAFADGAQTAGAPGADRNPEAISVPLPSPTNGNTAFVGPSVHYAIYHELGTHKMQARPYLGPAVESVASEVERNPEMFREVVTDGSR